MSEIRDVLLRFVAPSNAGDFTLPLKLPKGVYLVGSRVVGVHSSDPGEPAVTYGPTYPAPGPFPAPETGRPRALEVTLDLTHPALTDAHGRPLPARLLAAAMSALDGATGRGIPPADGPWGGEVPGPDAGTRPLAWWILRAGPAGGED